VIIVSFKFLKIQIEKMFKEKHVADSDNFKGTMKKWQLTLSVPSFNVYIELQYLKTIIF